MSLPMSLAYAVSRLQGYSTNYFRLETVNQSEASKFDVITLNLPVNSLINLKSLALHVMAKTEDYVETTLGSGQTVKRKVHVTLPRIDQLITRVELYAGGQQIQSGFQQYNTVSSVMHNLYSELQHTMSYERVMMNSETNITTLEDGSGYYTEAHPYILNNFLSFVGQSEPSYLDTSLMPQMQMRIYLAGPEVLGGFINGVSPDKGLDLKTNSAASNDFVQQATFKFDKIHFTIETITFSDAMYDQALEARIAEMGYLEIPFANYFTFFDNHDSSNSTSRFSLSSQSINKLIAVQRDENYRLPRGLQPLTDCCGPKYQPSYFQFKSGQIGSWQFNVNNLFVPNYRVSALGAYQLHQLCKADNYDSSAGDMVFSRNMWFNNLWAAVVRLNMPMGGMDSRNISGLDSRGLASQMYFTTTQGATGEDGFDTLQEAFGGAEPEFNNNNGRSETTIIACCTSTLLVGPGRQLSVTI